MRSDEQAGVIATEANPLQWGAITQMIAAPAYPAQFMNSASGTSYLPAVAGSNTYSAANLAASK